MDTITFELLPQAVTILTKEVSELKRLIISKQEQPQVDDSKQLLSIDEAADFLGLSKPTIYSKCSRGELPYMKRSKRLYFSRTELIEYIKAGRVKTNEERQGEVRNHLLKVKKGLNHEK